MIVRCANCHTEFSLDDQQIGPEGATVRCSVCNYVFPVEAPPGAGEHPWQIRTVEDLLFTAPDLPTLRNWIAEGRLHPDDQVSRTGRHWLRLGDMPEFSPAFSGFSDLPQVFEELEPSAGASALDELGPPPGFGETMPVVQGVDTGILDVAQVSGSFEVPVTSGSAAVERGPSEASGPTPFPLHELPEADVDVDVDVDDDDAPGPPREGMDESAVRMRPRPYSPTRPVSAIPVAAVPELVDDAPIEELRRRPPKATVRYGQEEVHGAASMLDAVTTVVDEEGAKVRPTAAAVERAPVQPREASDKRRAVASADRGGHAMASVALEDDRRPRRRSWPLLAGLGLVAGVAVMFGVPSIRAKLMGVAGDVVGEEPRFDPASLAELEQARAAVASLDPVALGQAEAALQGRLDEGKVPPEGVAEMKLAQVELLAMRALDHAMAHAIDPAVASPLPEAAVDDIELATQILGGLVAEDVVDRDHMRRVRGLVRLAQGRPGSEILPLLPEEGSAELRQLVAAAPLWRDPSGAVPPGLVAGIEGLSDRGTLAELALVLAYSRAGDDTKALELAQRVLARVPAQPTALAVQAKHDAAIGSPAAPPEGETEEGATEAPDKDPAGTKSGPPAKPVVRTESVDSLIERGCQLVDSGDVSEGLEVLRKAKVRRSTDLDLLSCMGNGHLKQGRTREALKAFDSALRVSPRFAEALQGAARAADKLGETEDAVRYYRRLLTVRQGDPAARAYIEAHGG